MNFLNHLETARGNGTGSRNIRLAAIKSFMHYMEYRVSEQSGSGQSIATFCKERGLPAWQFFAWKKRLQAQSWTRAFVFLKHEDEGKGAAFARRLRELLAG